MSDEWASGFDSAAETNTAASDYYQSQADALTPQIDALQTVINDPYADPASVYSAQSVYNTIQTEQNTLYTASDDAAALAAQQSAAADAERATDGLSSARPIQDSELGTGPTAADLGLLGINTDLPTNAALGELGFNTDLPLVNPNLGGGTSYNGILPNDPSLGLLGINTDLPKVNPNIGGGTSYPEISLDNTTLGELGFNPDAPNVTNPNLGGGTDSSYWFNGPGAGAGSTGINFDSGGTSGTDYGPQIPNQNTVSAFERAPDWRVRISLAPGSKYLYNAPDINANLDLGILAPLKDTNGILFPYMPTINVSYRANYDALDVPHSNYTSYSYRNSSVGDISIESVFTAQDTEEAQYMLAVIHFLRSVTKMFYGQDSNKGMPPPLVYLSGLGAYNFDNHPMAITNFSMRYPNDVDYINAYPGNGGGGSLGSYSSLTNRQGISNLLNFSGIYRLMAGGLSPGGRIPEPKFGSSPAESSVTTRVPTNLQISISCVPMISRYAVSNRFSTREYAKGNLLRGSVNRNNGGGMW